jgi:hypothetical protein
VAVETILIVLAFLACPLCMLVMGVMMLRPSSDEERHSVGDLRAEHVRLEREIERRERSEQAKGEQGSSAVGPPSPVR